MPAWQLLQSVLYCPTVLRSYGPTIMEAGGRFSLAECISFPPRGRMEDKHRPTPGVNQLAKMITFMNGGRRVQIDPEREK